MNAEQLFTRLPSPISGRPRTTLHPLSCIVHGPSSTARSQPSILPIFHPSSLNLQPSIFNRQHLFLEKGNSNNNSKQFPKPPLYP
jgi:hypothetical protein